jgi:hypothetical protein
MTKRKKISRYSKPSELRFVATTQELARAAIYPPVHRAMWPLTVRHGP